MEPEHEETDRLVVAAAAQSGGGPIFEDLSLKNVGNGAPLSRWMLALTVFSALGAETVRIRFHSVHVAFHAAL